jgi:putative transposase
MSSERAARRYAGMPRPLRNFVPGLPAHLVHRGNNRQPIFSCDADFLFFRACIDDALSRFDVALHSYVLMSNHVHLLMTPTTPGGISRAMQGAIRRYAGYFNARYGRTGTLWEGRFHAAVIEDDRYLLACHRYIDMNPVRAGIVRRPARYLWSSHRHLARGARDSIVRPHASIMALGKTEHDRHAAYRALFGAPIDPVDLHDIREAARRCRPLGPSLGLRPSKRRPGKKTRL